MTDEQGDRRIMQVTETLNEGLKRGYRITLTAAELDAKVEAKLKEAQPQVELKGFRKGKVPMALLRRQFGKQVLGEAMQEAIDGAMNDHFTATGDRPAARPDVTMENADWKEGDDVAVALSYETLPDVPEIDFKAIAIERPTVTPTDEEVAEALDQLARNATTYADRDEGAAAESGDQVVIDFEGRIDGEAFPGGAAEDFPWCWARRRSSPASRTSWWAPGPARRAISRSPSPPITAPNIWPARTRCSPRRSRRPGTRSGRNRRCAGQALWRRTLEAFAARFANNWAGNMRRRGASDRQARAARRARRNGGVRGSPGMLAAEAGQIAHQLWHEEHPEVQGHDHDEIEPDEEHLKLAERRVRLGLLLAELGRKHEITVPEADLREAIIAEARRYPGQERTFFEAVQQNPGLQQQIRAPLFEDKVIDFLFELVEVTEKPMTKAELQEAVDRLSED
jgi:trigger factor